jgi:oxidoreductase
VVGAGRIVERVHLPLLRERTDVDLACLYDPDRARAAELASALGVARACGSLDELADERLDVALVAAPNYVHAGTSARLLAAGVHVLCEKPMALSSSEARVLCAAAVRSERELMIAFPSRFRPEVVALREAVAQGSLGELRSVRCSWLRRGGVPGSWFTSRALSGGGALTDLGSHLVDVALSLAGPRRVERACAVLDAGLDAAAHAGWYASAQPATGVGDVEVGARCLAVCDGGLDLSLEVSWAAAVPEDRTVIEVTGTRGSARLDTLFGLSPAGRRRARPLRLWCEGWPTARSLAGSLDVLQPYRALWAFFIDSLRGGRSLRPMLAEARAGVDVVAAWYAAAGRAADVETLRTPTRHRALEPTA